MKPQQQRQNDLQREVIIMFILLLIGFGPIGLLIGMGFLFAAALLKYLER